MNVLDWFTNLEFKNIFVVQIIQMTMFRTSWLNVGEIQQFSKANTAKQTQQRKHSKENTAKKTRQRKHGKENTAKKTD